jgi:hypothetical protein
MLSILLWLFTRFYWPVTIWALATGQVRHTHVQVTGKVASVRFEDDGDLHIKLQSTAPRDTSWIIAECIPRMPCRRPRVGEIVTVRGISRRDPEHGWYEVHPVEEGP